MVAEQTHNELLASASVSSWDIIFKSWVDTPSASKKILVLDEFQYVGKANPAFPAIFQKIWDSILQERNVMVILCGSRISMMESQTLSYSSPLYGRRTGQIKLGQIPFEHYREFFPQKSQKELMEYYAVTGGVPKYIELFYESDNVYAAIANNVLSKASFLYDEPNFLLQREVGEVGSYFSVIKTIAAGNHKLSKIATALELKQTSLTKYLKTLMDLDILQREVPVTEQQPEKSKRGLYRIKDNFIAFWFKFVFPNLSYIESGHAELAMKRIEKNFIDAYVAFIYEDICLQRMWQLNAEDIWPFQFNHAGRWWDNQTEIDIVAYDSTGIDIIFGECKDWERPVGADVLRALKEKAKRVAWNQTSRRDHFILFSVSGFTSEIEQIARQRNDIVLIDSRA